MNETNLTACSNALTCLTDLIVSNPENSKQYVPQIMNLALRKLRINNVQNQLYRYIKFMVSILQGFSADWPIYIHRSGPLSMLMILGKSVGISKHKKIMFSLIEPIGKLFLTQRFV